MPDEFETGWSHRAAPRSSTSGRKSTVRERLIEFYRDENAFTIVEYAVAAGLIVATVAGAFQILGVTIDGIISGINAILAG